MMKSIAAKAVVPVALAVTGFVVVCCILLYSFIKNDLLNSSIQREVNLAGIIVKSTRHAMLQADRESLRNIIDNIGEQNGVEHVRIFNETGLVMFSAAPEEVSQLVDKKAAGCIACHSTDIPATNLGPMEQSRWFTNQKNHNVLAITAPIYNEPGCSTADCHFHPPTLKVLGTLDIGLSAEPLRDSLVTLGWRMVVFCIMVLILTVGGVCALLRRNILLPITNLVAYANAATRGNTDQPPPGGIDEIELIGQSLHGLALRLEKKQAELEMLRSKSREGAAVHKPSISSTENPG
ncbi:MAG: HAMP domain-containing protein [Desulfuromonadaceae bacterium GWC2_58_13]|nr:MAG: HAMP domain-containing protein [Desulfuromonadaceae bacterium GWC2_58_13]